jgi:hypothetical protein
VVAVDRHVDHRTALAERHGVDPAELPPVRDVDRHHPVTERLDPARSLGVQHVVRAACMLGHLQFARTAVSAVLAHVLRGACGRAKEREHGGRPCDGQGATHLGKGIRIC